MVRLELTNEQAEVVSLACDFYARVKIGQFGEIIDRTLDIKIPSNEYLERKRMARLYIIEARNEIYPDLHGFGHSYGYGKFADADDAIDVSKCIRHAMADDPEPLKTRKYPKCVVKNGREDAKK
jgi:hypothetical protein